MENIIPSNKTIPINNFKNLDFGLFVIVIVLESEIRRIS